MRLRRFLMTEPMDEPHFVILLSRLTPRTGELRVPEPSAPHATGEHGSGRQLRISCATAVNA